MTACKVCCTGQALKNVALFEWKIQIWVLTTLHRQKSNPTSAFIINNIWNIYLGKIFLGGLSYLKHSSITILSLQKCLNLYKKFCFFIPFMIWLFHSLNMFIECVLCAELGIKWESGCWLPAHTAAFWGRRLRKRRDKSVSLQKLQKIWKKTGLKWRMRQSKGCFYW